VTGEICPQCCGEQREVTVDCPLDCEHLVEARHHERPLDQNPGDIPEKDIHISSDFIDRNAPLVMFVSKAIYEGALSAPGAVDSDVLEALQALVKTYRTLESGLIYETRPPNPVAVAVQDQVKDAVEEFRQHMLETTGSQSVRDADVLGALTFLERVAWKRGNGRRRCKAFLSFLRQQFPHASNAPPIV
jgi:hypothetical protein